MSKQPTSAPAAKKAQWLRLLIDYRGEISFRSVEKVIVFAVDDEADSG